MDNLNNKNNFSTNKYNNRPNYNNYGTSKPNDKVTIVKPTPLNWVNKEHTGKACRYSYGDVVIKKVNDKKNSTSVRFLNGCFKKFTKNNYFVFAIDGTRMYFREADSYSGYKLSGNDDKSISRFGKFTEKQLPVGSVECGIYNLEFDKEYRLYFIDVNHKINADSKFNWKIKTHKHSS